ncbi:lipase family alpha/beta hydrolase [Piscinibacter sp.]|uniref:lipase family alpha/beta hydrolase n=1 Tax=Piscinibacter sp. TaxID=1903157 RepID=UPI002B7C7E18|nr:alpha/beta hydrolase [Albitalea sp.]HUG22516.1 alpha/beta hydrolase [Albitalea sp.]
MPRRPLPRNSDVRGAVRLATEATAGLADLVEAMHERIARLPGIYAPSRVGRTRGITGLVYKTVRGVTRLVGGSADALLGLLAPALSADDPSLQREAIVAALNGVLGDHLAATANPLAITMAFRCNGRPLVLERSALAAALPDAGGRLLVLLHGLCLNDLQWSRNGHDHGAALARELGYTPVYLHYNSGQHVSTNAQALAQQLERLLDQWPHAVQRLVLLGHSMGGLLARSAIHHGTQARHRWPARVDDLVFLGTPHHGAPLERAGNWVDLVLGATPYAAPFARLGKVRSAGITDLRHGYLLDEDWAGRDRFARHDDGRPHLPLPDGVRCFAMAATTGAQSGDLKDRLLGDGLVPLASALGRHADPARTLGFPEERQWVACATNHMQLLSSAAVCAQLQRWLALSAR